MTFRGRPPVRVGVAALLLAAAATGCGDENSAGGDVAVRDSAGIRITRNPGITAVPECRLSREPAVDIGTLDGQPEYEFYRVGDIARLPDGRLAVVDRGSREVRLYDQEGEFLRSFGGEGEGPGESLAPIWLWMRPDSLVVYGAEQQRFSWFTLDGAYVREVSIRPAAPGVNRAFLLRDGRIVTTEVEFQPSRTGFSPQPLRLVLHGSDGGAVDTLGEYVWRRMGVVGPEGGSYVTGPVFGARTYVAAGGRSLYVGRGVVPEIEILGPDGSRTGLVRWLAPHREVSDADLARHRRVELEGAESRNDSVVIRERLDDRGAADRFPAHERILVGKDGRLWVQRYRRPRWSGGERWLVFGPGGRLRCRIRLPERYQLMEAGEDFVLGTWRDELDVTHVRLHALELTDGG